MMYYLFYFDFLRISCTGFVIRLVIERVAFWTGATSYRDVPVELLA